MSVTISELAKHLNVSKGTVSRILNGRNDSLISEATRKRVLEAARELGYRPNHTARALATGRTGMIALQVDNLFHPHHAQMAHYMEAELTPRRYQLLINLSRRIAWEQVQPSEIPQWPVDGIIAHDDPFFVRAYLRMPMPRRTPVVSAGAFHTMTPDVDFVGVELSACARAAFEHLVAPGGKRIAYLVVGPIDLSPDPRYQAYLAVLREAGLQPEFIYLPQGTRAVARRTIAEYVRAKGCPDAIFCHNDDWAIGTYRGLRDLGLRLPEDTRLMGCDGIEDTEYFDPPISTIVQPTRAMCSLAWQYLEQRINDPSCPLQQTILQPILAIRESSRV
jgi:LacI family transcriptional regulator